MHSNHRVLWNLAVGELLEPGEHGIHTLATAQRHAHAHSGPRHAVGFGVNEVFGFFAHFRADQHDCVAAGFGGSEPIEGSFQKSAASEFHEGLGFSKPQASATAGGCQQCIGLIHWF